MKKSNGKLILTCPECGTFFPAPSVRCILLNYELLRRDGYQVFCAWCGHHGKIKRSERAAIKSWNRHAKERYPVAKVEACKR